VENTTSVRVWDILVRLFHWSLVISFTIAYFTSEQESPWHIYSGYTVAGLVLFRLIWGFIGTRYARFNQFIYSPAKVIEYAQGLIRRHPPYYAGHNPAGGWMIVALLIGLTVITITGLKLYAIEAGRGPLASGNGVEFSLVQNAYADRDEHAGKEKHEKPGEEFWEEFHEIATNLTLLLIFLHLAGVVLSSRLHGENLVKAMITGNKRTEQ